MLRAEELMVGDYLTFTDVQNDSRCPKLKVVVIDGATNELLVSVDGDPTLDRIDIDDELCGIPLTPEILEKNGFIYKDVAHNNFRGVWVCNVGRRNNVFIQFTDKVAIEIHNELGRKDEKGRADLVSFCRDWCEVLFVHELQHALRLCGIDKTIEL